MVVIAGIVLALGVLYLWLAGHWFGRALAFVAFAAALCFVVVASPVFVGVEMAAYLSSAGLAWLVAWVPMLVRRYQLIAIRVDGSPDISLELIGTHIATEPRQKH